MKQSDLRNMFKMASKNISTSTVAASPDPSSPAPVPTAIKIQENIEEDPEDRESADEGDILMEYTSH
jgi:hypothetical protein